MQATSQAFKDANASNDRVLKHAVTVELPIVRHNLCPTPSFQYGVGAWSPSGGASIDQATDWAGRTGGTSMKITWAAGAAGSQAVQMTAPCRLGSIYQVSATIRCATSQPGALLDVSTDGGGDAQATVGTGAGVNRVGVTLTSTGTTLTVKLALNATATAGQHAWIDLVLIEEVEDATAPLGTPFDGDDDGGEWTGYFGLSESTLNIDPYPDMTGTVDSYRIDRQLTSDMPAGTRLIAGYPAASGTLALSGTVDPLDQSKTAAWLFNPTNTDSPLYGLDPSGGKVTIDQGVYTTAGQQAETVRVFTGEVDECVVNPITKQVSLTLIDRRNELRGTASIPVDLRSLAANAGMTGEYAMDAVLRSCSRKIGVRRPQRPRTVLDVGFRTAMVPAVGRIDTGYGELDQAGVYGPSRTGSGFRGINDSIASPGNGVKVLLLDPAWGNGNLSAYNVYFEYGVTKDADQHWSKIPSIWLQLGAMTVAQASGAIQVRVTGASDPHGWTEGINVIVTDSATGALDQIINVPYTVDDNPHEVAIALHGLGAGKTTFTGSVWLDGVRKDFTCPTLATAMPHTIGNVWVGRLDLTSNGIGEFGDLGGSIEALQMTEEPQGVWWPWTATAQLDPSLNLLTFVPDVTGKDPWQILQDLATGESGIAGFDETGLFRFRNRDTIGSTSTVRTISSKDTLETIQSHSMKSAIATRVSATVNQPTQDAESAVFTAGTKYKVEARSTLTLTVKLAGPSVHLRNAPGDIGLCDFNGPVYPDPGNGLARTGVHTCADRNGNSKGANNQVIYPGTQNNGNDEGYITMTVTQVTADTAMIVFVNHTDTASWFVTPSANANNAYPAARKGQPAIWISGSLVTVQQIIVDSQWPPADEGGAAANVKYGDVTVNLPASDWRQDIDGAQAQCDGVLADLYQFRPIYESVRIVPDPSLQLGDSGTFDAPNAAQLNGEDMLITGSSLSGGSSGWTHDLTLRALWSPGVWVMGVVGRSEMGVATRV